VSDWNRFFATTCPKLVVKLVLHFIGWGWQEDKRNLDECILGRLPFQVQ